MKLADDLAEELMAMCSEYPSTELANMMAALIASKLKPRLTWSKPAPPNDQCGYTHTFAVTPFGRFLLTWKGWKESPDYGFDETPWGNAEYHGWDSVEDAQNWAAGEMARRIDAMLSGGKW